jgi:hypothetical protein
MHEYYGLLHIDQVEAGVDSRSQEFTSSVQLRSVTDTNAAETYSSRPLLDAY